MNKDRIKTNAESLVGEEAVVLQEISNLKAQGTVQIKGLEWTARTADNKDTIEKGAVVLVEKIDGVKLIVKEKGRLRYDLGYFRIGIYFNCAGCIFLYQGGATGEGLRRGTSGSISGNLEYSIHFKMPFIDRVAKE